MGSQFCSSMERHQLHEKQVKYNYECFTKLFYLLRLKE